MKIVARCGLKEIERRSPLMVTATTFVLFPDPLRELNTCLELISMIAGS
jgi:hypothetical protein